MFVTRPKNKNVRTTTTCPLPKKYQRSKCFQNQLLVIAVESLTFVTYFFLFWELPRVHSLSFTHLIDYMCIICIQQQHAWPLTPQEDSAVGKTTQVAHPATYSEHGHSAIVL